MAVLVLLLAALAGGDHTNTAVRSAETNCSIHLTRTLSGNCGHNSSGGGCPGSWGHRSGGCPWGCAADAHTMFTIRGCCAEFECDGAATRCCSHQHLHPQLCQCGPPPPPPVSGGVFVVDSRAAPGGNGSNARPFASIASCAYVAARARTSSTCRVRAGIYREEIVLDSPLGVEIVGDGAGSTVLDGTRPLDNLKWERYSGSMYRATIPIGPLRFPYRQLFVGGTYITEARWPNAQLDSMLNRSSWATMKDGSGWGVVQDPAMVNSLQSSNGSWDGGRVTLNLGTGVFTWVRTVQNFSVAHNHSSFHYETTLNSIKRPAGCADGVPCKNFVGNRYFLQGVLAALDSPGEWFLDQSAWQLYVWMPDSSPPAGLSVKFSDFCLRKEAPANTAATQLVAERKDPARPVKLANISFNGCTLELLDCHNCSVQDVKLSYPNYESTSIDGSCGKVEGNKCHMPAMTLLQGTNSIFDKVYLVHSNNAGIMLVGSGHTVNETLIESTDWLGSLAFPPIKVGFSIHKANIEEEPGAATTAVAHSVGTYSVPNQDETRVHVGMPMGVNNRITRSSVRGFGNSGIVTSQLANEVSYTHVSHGGLIGGDDACIHADNAPVKCDAGDSPSNCWKSWHHNYVHDCREKCVRCDDNSRGCDINHCVVFNCGQPLRNGAPAGILVKGDRNKVWACTVFNASAGGQGDLVAITEFGQNKHSEFFNIAARRIGTRQGPPLSSNSTAFAGGLVIGESLESLRLADPSTLQFKPQIDSPLFGTGVTHAPDEPAAHPNVGAYQPADAWVPGCTFHPRCKAPFI